MLKETNHAGCFLVSEANGTLSRDLVTLAASQIILPGTILGKIAAALEAASAAKAGGNTGAGTLTLDATTPVLAGAKVGVYVVRCIAAASNSGTFRVEDPDGNVLGDVAVGATFADDVKFVIADVGADFIVGDGFDITVAADVDATNIGQYAALDLAATNGAAVAAAIAYDATTTGVGETAEIVIVARQCEVNAGELLWPEGITDQQKATALAVLGDHGILAR